VAVSKLAVAILAGGEASRLGGRDKGLESLGGRPLIEWSIEFVAQHVRVDRNGSLASGDVEVAIIANRHREAYERYGHVREDLAAGFRGPLAGIASALAGSNAPLVMTLPVDCPRPPEDLATRLLDAIGRVSTNAAVANDGERRQPLFALYQRSLVESAAAAALARRGVWEWQDEIGAREVDFSDRRRQFHNLNTPEDFAAYDHDARTRD
jgi:molybdopterin-guanine dinucleotide biosynthesis protein A